MAYGPPVTTTATTLSALTPPGTPSGLTATPGSNRVRLNWTAASGATGYVVEYRQGTGQWQPGYSGPNTQATITGLTPDTEYEFRLKATNAAGDSGWATVTVKTKIEKNFVRIIRITKGMVFTPIPEGLITGG